MLKKLHDAAKAVLALRDGQHSLTEETDAFENLSAAVDAAAAELKAARKASTKSKSKAAPKKKA